MARPKAFDQDTALQRAIALFREKGYAGASTDDLLGAMGIGRQSMYDTFGDKRGLYLAALERYNAASIAEFTGDMEAGASPLDGLEAALRAFARRAGAGREGCMGVTAVFEFGQSDPEVASISAASARAQLAAIERRLASAGAAGETPSDLDARAAAAFVASSLAGMRVAARGGADARALEQIAVFTMRALRRPSS
ncbi:TetR/AcrR family transcriptional regulator [Pseudoduganella namucuonensis]|uniref:Transcriptional regulator, TetR family n=1 Tax=Pseudoduganella namucuonensis TaxID=1035707 RepID=A0A1I7INK6_9BURK|nr:TetR/AcrR family transcriptional regulator [Pseudoduganella namucuonensis]SFU74501.1 transcriptional regulator, TetR family [Pseudoduganella namucuonensis]